MKTMKIKSGRAHHAINTGMRGETVTHNLHDLFPGDIMHTGWRNATSVPGANDLITGNDLRGE